MRRWSLQSSGTSLVAKCAAVAVAVTLAGSAAQAQVVTGTIRVADADTPAGGALVSLHTVNGSGADVVEVLSRADGSFAIQARRAGRFILRVKRIGLRAWESQPFDLTQGERKPMKVELDRVAHALSGVVVSTVPLCAVRGDEGPRVAQLWDDASTALRATRVSLRDSLVEARMMRYTRELAPRTLRVLAERASAVSGSVLQPFRSRSSDSLAADGFWASEGDSVRYEAPDHEVLLSGAFVRSHCFSIDEGARADSLVGLTFSPTDRRQRDIEGVMWLDRATSELRRVTFRYTGVRQTEHANQLGGELHFARLPEGTWVVRRWFVRMPLYSQERSVSSGIRYGEPEIAVLVEEGGSIVARGIESFERPGRVVGVMRDSTGRALPNAVIALTGTPHVTTTSRTGAFELNDVAPGVYEVVAEHADYDRFGVPAAVQEVVVNPGATMRPGLRALASDSLLTLACAGQARGSRSGVARIRLLGADGLPVTGARIHVVWATPTISGGDVLVRNDELSGTTDRFGGVSFCDLPPDEGLSVVLVPADGVPPVTLDQFRLEARQFVARDVRVP